MTEVAKGFGLGTTSLIEHTFAGVFNSLFRITNSLGDISSKLTFDEEYIKKRKE